jgi:hypothetical protein
MRIGRKVHKRIAGWAGRAPLIIGLRVMTRRIDQNKVDRTLTEREIRFGQISIVPDRMDRPKVCSLEIGSCWEYGDIKMSDCKAREVLSSGLTWVL